MHRILRCLNDIAHDGAGCRRVPGATALQHHILEGMTVQINRIQGSVHPGQRMICRQECRMHPGLNGIAVVLSDGQQLQHIAHFPAEGDILRRDIRNPFPVHILHIHPAVEPDGTHDAQLVGRVEALHVRRGVRLRQTEALRVLQHGFILRAFRSHPGQDIVRRSVDDAHHLLNMIGNQGTLQRVDDRNRTADTGFVVQPGAGLPGHGTKLVKMEGKGHLVRSDHGFSVLQRAQHHGCRRLFPAQKFADDLDFRILQDVIPIGGQHFIRHFLAAVDLFVQHERLLDPQLQPGPLFHFSAEFTDQIPHASADIAESQQPQYDFLHLQMIPLYCLFRSYISRSPFRVSSPSSLSMALLSSAIISAMPPVATT